jgi:hypothetical protein
MASMLLRTSSRASIGIDQCQGYLFRLKENNKEWNKLYAVLRGTDLVYYDSPQNARGPPRSKDDVKQVLSARSYDEFAGVRPPTGTPSYLIIETTHAKMIYCAKSADDRQMWLANIGMNLEAATRDAMQRSASVTVAKEGARVAPPKAPLEALGRSKTVGGAAPAAKASGGMLGRAAGFFGMAKKPESDLARTESVSSSAVSSSAVSSRVVESSAPTTALAAPAIPDEQLDEALKQMVSALGLPPVKAEAIFKLSKELKRDMLKGAADDF